MKILAVFLVFLLRQFSVAQPTEFSLPSVSEGEPAAGKRVVIKAPEFANTPVHHTLYLPQDWDPEWEAKNKSWPVIVEYTGNFYETSGSTGEVEDAGLGYGISAGRFIWVVLPFVSSDHQHNERTWWGDERVTVNYAITNVPRICLEFGGDSRKVLLCGFSRGAIAVNYIGLHNDAIAKLWCGFVSHDHYDGVREWQRTDWGTPLDKYRANATDRLKRLDGRPVLACQSDGIPGARELETYLSGHLAPGSYKFLKVNMSQIFPSFPNAFAKHPHNDLWLLKDSPDRRVVWNWVDQVIAKAK